jgi:hypothetical protein
MVLEPTIPASFSRLPGAARSAAIVGSGSVMPSEGGAIADRMGKEAGASHKCGPKLELGA